MKNILKITSILGVVTIIKILAGVIRTKFLAWQIGPFGIGLVSQATTYSMLTIQVCSLSIVMGILKNVSESFAQNDLERASLTINMSVTLQFIASAIFIILVLPFSGYLTRFVFSDARYFWYFVGITVVTPFALFLVGIVDPVFYGFRKIKEYTRLMIIYTIAGLIIIFPAVYFFKTEGMLTQIIIISVIGFLASYYFIVKETSIRPRIDFGIFKNKQSQDIMRQLLKYGLTSFLMGSATLLTMLYLRSLLIKQFGAAANGYYQVAYAVSAAYLPFVTNAIWGYFYPAMCALNKEEDINHELNQFFRFAVFVSTAVAALCIIFRYYAILILYSKEFMPAYGLLAIQAVGDIFFILFCIFSTSLMARKKFREVIYISTIGYNIFLVCLYTVFSKIFTMGFQSLNTAIAVTSFVFSIILVICSKADTGFVLNGKNIALSIKSATLIAVICMIPGHNILAILLKVVMIPGWLFLSVTKGEAKNFIGIVSSAFKGKFANA